MSAFDPSGHSWRNHPNKSPGRCRGFKFIRRSGPVRLTGNSGDGDGGDGGDGGDDGDGSASSTVRIRSHSTGRSKDRKRSSQGPNPSRPSPIRPSPSHPNPIHDGDGDANARKRPLA